MKDDNGGVVLGAAQILDSLGTLGSLTEPIVIRDAYLDDIEFKSDAKIHFYNSYVANLKCPICSVSTHGSDFSNLKDTTIERSNASIIYRESYFRKGIIEDEFISSVIRVAPRPILDTSIIDSIIDNRFLHSEVLSELGPNDIYTPQEHYVLGPGFVLGRHTKNRCEIIEKITKESELFEFKTSE